MVGELVSIPVETHRRVELIDVTARLQQVVQASGFAEGVLTAQVLHTTAGLTINENADPDVVRDLLDQLDRLAPEQQSYRHREGNSDAHIKTALTGTTLSILVSKSRLVLGTWQGIYFCEYDGPRARTLVARVIG